MATLSSVAAPSLTNRSSIARAQRPALPPAISASSKTKTGFHGVSLVDTRWAVGHRKSGGSGRRRLLQVNARSTAAKNIEVEVEKPLGLALGQKPGGGVVITLIYQIKVGSCPSRPALPLATSDLLLLRTANSYISRAAETREIVIMSYWGSSGGSPAWAASRGPSPVVPLLVVVALGWVICQETLMSWYEQVTELEETVTDNAVILVIGAGVILFALAASGGRSEVVFVPAALVVVMFLIQNIMLAALLLLVAVYFAGIYYYQPDGRYGGSGFGSEWGGGGGVGIGGGGLGFYMLLLLCLLLCAMFSDGGGSWWVPALLLVACVLCLNFFSGGKVWGYEYF